MQRYDSYKDSGVKWLGEIPSHWEVKRLRAALTERKERYSSSESLMILSLIKDKGIIPYDEKGEVGNKSKDDHTQYKVARKGDLVINSMNVIIGSLGVTPYDGYISPAYYAFKPQKGINLAYYNYLLSLRKVQQSIRCFSKGIMEIRLKISAYDFLSMPFPFPSLKEQEAIANYLDTATSKIDEAIAQQQKMIDLLNERKQIIINNAVTKGLDPNVKMKPSGIDWIGDIPKHWGTLPIKHFKSKVKNAFVDGPFGSNLKSEHYVEGGDVYVIESGMVTTGIFVNKNFKTITLSHFKTIERSECKTGDVIIAKIGAKFGMAAELPELGKRCVVSGNSLKITLNQKKMINPLFVCYMGLAKIKGGFIGLYQETAQPALSLGGLNNMYFPVPPLQEQIEIAQYLSEQIKTINLAIDYSNKQISLLQERKQIIINDVVTGKVKVV